MDSEHRSAEPQVCGDEDCMCVHIHVCVCEHVCAMRVCMCVVRVGICIGYVRGMVYGAGMFAFVFLVISFMLSLFLGSSMVI